MRKSQRRPRQSKGTISIETNKGWLRLRWSHNGSRYVLYLGLPDDEVNRLVAEQRAGAIRLDILSGNFDPTLKKYKSEEQITRSLISPAQLIDRFVQYKEKMSQCSKAALSKYKGLRTRLEQYFEDKPADRIKETDAQGFIQWLSECIKLKPVTLRERLSILRACWQWGIEQELIEQKNPWKNIRIKSSRTKGAQPFTSEECRQILMGFRTDPHYAYYSDFVDFRLSIGCRPGEAAALRWENVSDECDRVWIVESYTRGELKKNTKTEKNRVFKVPARVQKMLRDRRPENYKPEELVFPAKKGGYIDDSDFRNRAWIKVLKKVGVEYRKPYATRATGTSHLIESGMSVADVSVITGNTPETIYRHYLGTVANIIEIPDFMNEED